MSHRLSTLQVAVPQVSSAVAKRYRLLEPICGTAATCVERPKPIDPEPCPTIKELGRATVSGYCDRISLRMESRTLR